MIVAQRKPFDEIKDMIKDYKRVLNVGKARQQSH